MRRRPASEEFLRLMSPEATLHVVVRERETPARVPAARAFPGGAQRHADSLRLDVPAACWCGNLRRTRHVARRYRTGEMLAHSDVQPDLRREAVEVVFRADARAL